MKILILNQPLYNKGDSAAHKSLVRALSARKYKLTVLLTNANQAALDEFSVDGVRYKNLTSSLNILRLKFQRLFYRIIFFLNKPFLANLWSYLRQISNEIRMNDLIICAPGGICMGGFRNWNHICILWLAKYYNKPIAYYSRSIGPFSDNGFSNKLFKKESVKLLHYFSFLALRDKKSAKLVEKFNLNYLQTVDPVFLDRPADFHFENPYKKEIGNDYIVFVPNSLTWHYAYKKVLQSTIDSFYIKILEVILNKYATKKIVMLPQLFSRAKGDYHYFKTLKEKINDTRIIVLPDCVSSDLQQKIISESSLVIGSRYHSIVFALNNCIPFISLSYEHKMTGLLEVLDKMNCSIDMTKITTNAWNEKEYIEQIAQLFDEVSVDQNARKKAHEIAQNCMDELISFINKEKEKMC